MLSMLRRKQTAFSDTLKEAIKTAGGRNAKSVMALLDVDALKASKDQSEDIQKALEKVKEQMPMILIRRCPCRVWKIIANRPAMLQEM